jgi:ribosomal protein L11 methyltransferase
MTEAEPRSYLSVRVGPEQLDAVSGLLTEAGCVAIDARPEGELCAYAAREAELDDWTERLRQRFGNALGIRKIPLGDEWKVDWVKALEPIDITPTLRIEPLDPGRARATPTTGGRLVLEPAFAFGFGEHPTTRMLVRWLERAIEPGAGQTVLDFGCGTGVLGLAALRFGAARVIGLDISPEAVAASRRNACLNQLSARCRFSCAQLSSLATSFDVVVANVDAKTLAQHCAEFATRMSRRGRIGLSGFLSEQTPGILATLAEQDIEVAPISEEDGWVVVAGSISRE